LPGLWIWPISRICGREILPLGEYVMSVRRRGLRWRWSIHGLTKPLGLKWSEDGFESWDAAKLAGEAALKELLDGLARETQEDQTGA